MLFGASFLSAGCFGASAEAGSAATGAYGSKPPLPSAPPPDAARPVTARPVTARPVTTTPDALLAAARAPDEGVLGALAGRPRGPALAGLTRGEAFHPGRRPFF